VTFTVIDGVTRRAGGLLALMEIRPANGVIEIGNILLAPALQKTRVATEAFHLAASRVFALGYRRLEWKCDDRNAASKRAALRFGFKPEGLFRQHMIVKGDNRDTAWFAILDHEWPRLNAGFRTWLASENFDAEGRQNRRLSECLDD
jgi:RimJ/RimL family protein N-acetyltransferase